MYFSYLSTIYPHTLSFVSYTLTAFYFHTQGFSDAATLQSERDAAAETAEEHSGVSSADLPSPLFFKNYVFVAPTLACPLQKQHMHSTLPLALSATLSHCCRVEKKDEKKKTTDAPAAPLL